MWGHFSKMDINGLNGLNGETRLFYFPFSSLSPLLLILICIYAAIL